MAEAYSKPLNELKIDRKLKSLKESQRCVESINQKFIIKFDFMRQIP